MHFSLKSDIWWRARRHPPTTGHRPSDHSIRHMVLPSRFLLCTWCLLVSSGSIRLLRPVGGPSQHVLTLQMEVQSRQGVVMSRHIAHITIHIGAYRF